MYGVRSYRPIANTHPQSYNNINTRRVLFNNPTPTNEITAELRAFVNETVNNSYTVLRKDIEELKKQLKPETNNNETADSLTTNNTLLSELNQLIIENIKDNDELKNKIIDKLENIKLNNDVIIQHISEEEENKKIKDIKL